MDISISICRVDGAEDLPLPAYATPHSSGLDLCAAVPAPLVLSPGERALVPTGFRYEIPPGFEGQVRPRSGLALRHGLSMVNTPGTIDADYRGELKVIVINHGTEPFTVSRGDRIAQLVFAPVSRAELVETRDLTASVRSEGGFGHTGV